MAVEISQESVTLNADIQDGGKGANSVSCGEVPDDMAQGSECHVFQDDLSTEDELPSSAMPGTPLARLDAAYARCMRVSAEELDLEPAVYIREGSELMSQMKDQLVMLPDLDDLSPECDIEAADVGEPGESTKAQEKQPKSMLKRHKKIFLGDGNAAPPPARGVIFVNSFIQLSNYPLPLIDDLITGFEGMMWFMSLDMASDFWTVRMTERAKLILAFTCPFGHFQWVLSLPKSEFGKRVISYLSHELGAEGIRATPKIIKDIQEELPFPSTLKGVQSFLGSLNYYHKFIEDYAVIAASLYELTDDQVRAGRHLSRAKESFEILKKKIVSTPLLRHPDRTKPFVIIPHANQWAACAVLGQMHDGLVQPVRFTGRVLSDTELKYHIAEKEVLAVMRVLHVFKNVIEGCPLIIYTRHSVLINSKTAEGRLVPWGVALSQYDLKIRKVSRDEDGLAAIMGAGITSREHLDEVAEILIPVKGRVKPPPVVSVEMLSEEYSGVVLSFDGAAKISTRKGSCGCILWQLPEWKVLDARGYILDG
ncbi:reverse transcriptase, partial [Phytophthora megakarya]